MKTEKTDGTIADAVDEFRRAWMAFVDAVADGFGISRAIRWFARVLHRVERR